MIGSRYEAVESVTPAEIAALDDTELPLYTILVPVYHEANVVGLLMDNLGRLDYPKEKLEIFLLLEADDDETRQAAMAARPPETVTIVTVPPGQPQTKPKACNVGLYLARGEFLVIYDAEDRPDPQQLKAALVAFRRADEHRSASRPRSTTSTPRRTRSPGCSRSSTRSGSTTCCPASRRCDLPIPLGGTSNHFRTQALRQLGGWDPFNVTEDADLGIRSAALGETVGVIGSTTYEEANRAYGELRPPAVAVGQGLPDDDARAPPPPDRARPPARALQVARLRPPRRRDADRLPAAAAALRPLHRLADLQPGDAEQDLPRPRPVDGTGVAHHRQRAHDLRLDDGRLQARPVPTWRMWALANPLYWLLHSVASYKALWQLIVKPHYWEKTVHGLTGDDPRSPDLP